MSSGHEHHKYLIVVEEAGDGSFSAYVPDLPGCASCGETMDEVRESIKEAIALHIEGLQAEGIEVPVPHSTSGYVLAAV